MRTTELHFAKIQPKGRDVHAINGPAEAGGNKALCGAEPKTWGKWARHFESATCRNCLAMMQARQNQTAEVREFEQARREGQATMRRIRNETSGR